MNWGGIIAGALGGGAQAVGEIADANLKEQAAQRAEQRSLQLNMERFKQEADYKLRLDRQAQERYMADAERVTSRAGANMRGQDAATLDTLNDRVGGEAPEMSREEIAKLLEENPQYRQVYEQAGYMAPRRQSGIIGEEVKAARELGADPALRKDLTQAQKDATTAERDAVRQAQQDRRLDQADDREARRAAETAARLELDAQRLELLAQGKDKVTSSDRINLNTTISTNQRVIRDASEQLKTLRVTDPNNPRVSELEADIADSQRLIKTAQAILMENLEGKRATPAPSPAPAPRPGAAAPAAGGSKLGNLPGEANEARALQDAFVREQMAYLEAKTDLEKNRAVVNMEEIQKRAKRLGLNLQNGDNAASAPAARPPLSAFKK